MCSGSPPNRAASAARTRGRPSVGPWRHPAPASGGGAAWTRRRYSGRVGGRARGSEFSARNKPFTDWSVFKTVFFAMIGSGDCKTAQRKQSNLTSRRSRMDGLVYVGGAFRPAADAAISVFDHGLLYGD